MTNKTNESNKYKYMKVLGKDTIEFSVLDVNRRVFFSFGMDRELIDIIGTFISDFYSLKAEAESIESLTSIEESLGDLKNVLKEVKMQPSILYKTLTKELTLYYDVVCKLGSFILTQRDSYGKVTDLVTATQIAHAEEFQKEEWKEFFKELLDFCIQRFNALVKEKSDENPPEETKEGEG